MSPVPRHLRKIFQVDVEHSEEFSLEGKLCCECGCKEFLMRIFADIDDNDIPESKEYEDDYAFVIKGICNDCQKEWLLFDMSKHGYNGYVCHDGVTVPDVKLKEYSCPKCKKNKFELSIGIELEDIDQFVEEVVADDPDHFSKEDYVDAFDWITIDKKCSCCGEESKSWIDFETS